MSQATDEKKKNPSRKKKSEGGNLTSFGTLDAEKEHEIHSKGGKKSAESRKKKKELRELTKAFLMQDAIGPVKANLQKLGFDDEDMTNLAAILGVMYTKVINSGDINAAKMIMGWSGMDESVKIQESMEMAKLQQILEVKDVNETVDETNDVVFYIPDNGRDDVEVVTIDAFPNQE